MVPTPHDTSDAFRNVMNLTADWRISHQTDMFSFWACESASRRKRMDSNPILSRCCILDVGTMYSVIIDKSRLMGETCMSTKLLITHITHNLPSAADAPKQVDPFLCQGPLEAR